MPKRKSADADQEGRILSLYPVTADYTPVTEKFIADHFRFDDLNYNVGVHVIFIPISHFTIGACDFASFQQKNGYSEHMLQLFLLQQFRRTLFRPADSTFSLMTFERVINVKQQTRGWRFYLYERNVSTYERGRLARDFMKASRDNNQDSEDEAEEAEEGKKKKAIPRKLTSAIRWATFNLGEFMHKYSQRPDYAIGMACGITKGEDEKAKVASEWPAIAHVDDYTTPFNGYLCSAQALEIPPEHIDRYVDCLDIQNAVRLQLSESGNNLEFYSTPNDTHIVYDPNVAKKFGLPYDPNVVQVAKKNHTTVLRREQKSRTQRRDFLIHVAIHYAIYRDRLLEQLGVDSERFEPDELDELICGVYISLEQLVGDMEYSNLMDDYSTRLEEDDGKNLYYSAFQARTFYLKRHDAQIERFHNFRWPHPTVILDHAWLQNPRVQTYLHTIRCRGPPEKQLRRARAHFGHFVDGDEKASLQRLDTFQERRLEASRYPRLALKDGDPEPLRTFFLDTCEEYPTWISNRNPNGEFLTAIVDYMNVHVIEKRIDSTYIRFLDQDYNDESCLSHMIADFIDITEKKLSVNCSHMHLLVNLLVAFDSLRDGIDPLRINAVNHGPTSTGKSFILMVLMKLLIPGSFAKITRASRQADNGPIPIHGRTQCEEEACDTLGINSIDAKNEAIRYRMISTNEQASKNGFAETFKDRLTERLCRVETHSVDNGHRATFVIKKVITGNYIKTTNHCPMDVNAALRTRSLFIYHPGITREDRSILETISMEGTDANDAVLSAFIEDLRRDQSLMMDFGNMIYMKALLPDFDIISRAFTLFKEFYPPCAEDTRCLRRAQFISIILAFRRAVKLTFDIGIGNSGMDNIYHCRRLGELLPFLVTPYQSIPFVIHTIQVQCNPVNLAIAKGLRKIFGLEEYGELHPEEFTPLLGESTKDILANIIFPGTTKDDMGELYSDYQVVKIRDTQTRLVITQGGYVGLPRYFHNMRFAKRPNKLAKDIVARLQPAERHSAVDISGFLIALTRAQNFIWDDQGKPIRAWKIDNGSSGQSKEHHNILLIHAKFLCFTDKRFKRVLQRVTPSRSDDSQTVAMCDVDPDNGFKPSTLKIPSIEEENELIQQWQDEHDKLTRLPKSINVDQVRPAPHQENKQVFQRGTRTTTVDPMEVDTDVDPMYADMTDVQGPGDAPAPGPGGNPVDIPSEPHDHMRMEMPNPFYRYTGPYYQIPKRLGNYSLLKFNEIGTLIHHLFHLVRHGYITENMNPISHYALPFNTAYLLSKLNRVRKYGKEARLQWNYMVDKSPGGTHDSEIKVDIPRESYADIRGQFPAIFKCMQRLGRYFIALSQLHALRDGGVDVHLVRHLLNLVGWTDPSKTLLRSLTSIYRTLLTGDIPDLPAQGTFKRDAILPRLMKFDYISKEHQYLREHFEENNFLDEDKIMKNCRMVCRMPALGPDHKEEKKFHASGGLFSFMSGADSMEEEEEEEDEEPHSQTTFAEFNSSLSGGHNKRMQQPQPSPDLDQIQSEETTFF